MKAVDEIQQAALQLAADLNATAASIASVARETSQEAARWAFTQCDLRKRARTKFALADQMLFTREALEQATHERIARYHAAQFPQGEIVADLTCGIGADLIALSRRGPTIGYETDPERAEYARYNLAVHELEAEIRVQDCLVGDWDFEYAFADPARRVAGRRTLHPSEFLPDPSDLSARMKELKLGGMKLSPLLSDIHLRSFGQRVEFLSFGGECREALEWLGTDARSGHGAVHVESGEWVPSLSDLTMPAEAPDDWFFDTDPAAVRADALGTLSRQFALQPLGDSNGYLTGRGKVESIWLKPYRVLGHGRFDVKSLKAELKGLGAATPVLKQRHAGLELVKLVRQLRMEGSRKVSVAFYPIGKSIRYAILD